VTLQAFEKWEIDFLGPIQPQGENIGAKYIITTTKYLTRWVKTWPVKDCIGAIVEKFISEYVLTRFRCPNILMRD